MCVCEMPSPRRGGGLRGKRDLPTSNDIFIDLRQNNTDAVCEVALVEHRLYSEEGSSVH